MSKELIAAVKAHALAHYNDGGWDVIVEAWEDSDIAECIEGAGTAAEAIAKVSRVVEVYADRQADARISREEWCRDCGRVGVSTGHMDCLFPGMRSEAR